MNPMLKLNPMNDKLLLPQNEYMRPRYDQYAIDHAASTDEDRRNAIIAAHQPGANDGLKADYATAHLVKINLSIWAVNYALSLFEVVELPADDFRIEVVTTRDQRFNVLETAAHGAAPNQTFAGFDSPTNYTPYQLDSGVVDYPIVHAMRGRIDYADRIDEDVSRSYDNKINDDLWVLLKAAINTYPSGTYNLDSRYVNATWPTTNEISITGEGAFTYEIYKRAISHFRLMGKSLRVIIINPTELDDTWDWQTVVSSTTGGSQDGRTLVTTRVKETIERDGVLSGQLLGSEVMWITDPTVAKMVAYIFSEEPAGTLYTVPDLDSIRMFDGKDMKIMSNRENVNGMQRLGWIKPLIIGPQRLNFARITFESAQ